MSKLKLVEGAGSGVVCDVNTGICAPADLGAGDFSSPAPSADWELIYVGDPLCSACWGVAPTVSQLPQWAAEQGAKFSIVVGGLRPGGGDAWDDKFRAFLRQHWTEMAEHSGQPFELGLLDREQFNYDTEPSARAVVVARAMLGAGDPNAKQLTEFFQDLQHRFYVLNEDPNELEFYREPVAKLELDFAEFSRRFQSAEARTATRDEFLLNRSWGVRGFPSFVLRSGDKVEILGSGFLSVEEIASRVAASELSKPAPVSAAS